MEAEEFMFRSRWLDLVSLILTSADLITSRVSEKGTLATCFANDCKNDLMAGRSVQCLWLLITF